MSNDLLTLIEQYWDLAYAEGKEGRTQDTEAGDAQRVLYDIEDTIAALEAVHPVGVPDGMKLVPIEPTEAMIEAGAAMQKHFYSDCRSVDAIYQAMLAVAPSLPVEEKVQIEPVMGEMDEKTKMVTPYITQEQFDKTFPADPTAKIAAQGEKK